MSDHPLYNRCCPCQRCARKRIMSGAVLLTLGGLFLVNEFTRFGFQWPVLLIVIGLVMVWAQAGSTEGHVPRGLVAPPSAPPPPPSSPDSQVPHV